MGIGEQYEFERTGRIEPEPTVASVNSASQPLVIRMGFDPLTCACEDTRAVFTDEIARTLYLLWRRNHITSDQFPRRCLQIARQIKSRRPATGLELSKCFPYWDVDFTTHDVAAFCPAAIPYFRGEQQITYEVIR